MYLRAGNIVRFSRREIIFTLHTSLSVHLTAVLNCQLVWSTWYPSNNNQINISAHYRMSNSRQSHLLIQSCPPSITAINFSVSSPHFVPSPTVFAFVMHASYAVLPTCALQATIAYHEPSHCGRNCEKRFETRLSSHPALRVVLQSSASSSRRLNIDCKQHLNAGAWIPLEETDLRFPFQFQ